MSEGEKKLVGLKQKSYSSGICPPRCIVIWPWIVRWTLVSYLYSFWGVREMDPRGLRIIVRAMDKVLFLNC